MNITAITKEIENVINDTGNNVLNCSYVESKTYINSDGDLCKKPSKLSIRLEKELNLDKEHDEQLSEIELAIFNKYYMECEYNYPK